LRAKHQGRRDENRATLFLLPPYRSVTAQSHRARCLDPKADARRRRLRR
jgi:hypothetical protein